jgi:hypothetical protein
MNEYVYPTPKLPIKKVGIKVGQGYLQLNLIVLLN